MEARDKRIEKLTVKRERRIKKNRQVEKVEEDFNSKPLFFLPFFDFFDLAVKKFIDFVVLPDCLSREFLCVYPDGSRCCKFVENVARLVQQPCWLLNQSFE
jgi:hypothetical protein